MLSPQIYIAKFDKTLIFKSLDYTSHKMSSLVIAGTKAKTQKGQNKGEKRENAPQRNGVGKSEKRRQKMCEKKRWYDRKEITFVICRVES